MYEICVGACGVSPEYFKTQMTIPEAAALVRGFNRRQRVGYDQARLVARVVAACHCSSLPEDFLRFPWEEEPEPQKSAEEEAKELEALRAMIPLMEERIKQQNYGQ